MNRLKSIIYILSIIWIAMVLSGCVDEGLGRHVSSNDKVLVNLEASFSPFSEGDLTRGSNVAPARGFNTISDMAILVFDQSGNLLPDYLKEVVNPETTDVERNDTVAAYNKSAESDTKRVADVPLLLPNGTYYIIAVANFGEYESNESGVISIKKDINGKNITSLAKIINEINKYANPEDFTLDSLRSLKVDWDVSDYANNRAMLGFFSLSDSKPYAGSKFETVALDRSGQKPRAWLRRCASKITVDFDGSGLRDNVSIFIKDVRIFDLAKECTLGFGNPTSDEENLTDFNNHPSSEEDLTQRPSSEYNGHYIEFGEGDNPDSWPRISKHTPYIMEADGKTRKKLHTQDSECLYFYENMQGTREGYDRSPKPDLSNGGLAEGYNKKDGMPYGTYIEVSARHVVEEDGESHYKDTKYRFMIGKNVTDNFDAERNHHYKLTLAFNGTSDEYHWHIDYARSEEGFKVPNPWYVSYSYNQDAYLPFEFNLSNEWEIENMVAEIETNPWYPTTSSDYVEGNDSDLADPDYEIKPQVPDGDEPYPYESPTNIDNKRNSNGFLSLRAPSDETVLTDKRVGFTFTGYNDDLIYEPERYYNGLQAGTDAAGNPVPKVNLGKRTIIENAAPSPNTDNERETISVKRENGVYSIGIPLFTREKALVKETGYSGNNPFVGYQRVAKVKLTAKVRKKNDHSQTEDYEAKVNVVQVRRVVNPKGVYRKAGNCDPFHVNLKFLTSERSDGEFKSIISRGPWMAEILGDNNFITLDGKQRVSGSSRSQIDFTIKFNRMGGSVNKNAIVRIKYHNYTCTHLIFVRQGYAPQAICGGGPVYNNPNAQATQWNTFNMHTGNIMADDPRDEGSMFKFGNAWNCIASSNNIYKDKDGNPIYYEQSEEGFKPQETLVFLQAAGNVHPTCKTWGASGRRDDGFTEQAVGNMKINKAATMRDFEQLYLTKYIEFGYGVLYADGATETQTSLEMVNGWYRDDTTSVKNKKGMRGVFAYYWNPNEASEFNTRNIFFPIGRSGYGHRKHSNEAPENIKKGILRYSCNRYIRAHTTTPQYEFRRRAPLLEFIYRRMGAIYWARTKTAPGQYLTWNGDSPSGGDADGCAIGLDLNYYTFDVNAISNKSVSDGEDACFVRTVERSAGD